LDKHPHGKANSINLDRGKLRTGRYYPAESDVAPEGIPVWTAPTRFSNSSNIIVLDTTDHPGITFEGSYTAQTKTVSQSDLLETLERNRLGRFLRIVTGSKKADRRFSRKLVAVSRDPLGWLETLTRALPLLGTVSIWMVVYLVKGHDASFYQVLAQVAAAQVIWAAIDKPKPSPGIFAVIFESERLEQFMVNVLPLATAIVLAGASDWFGVAVNPQRLFSLRAAVPLAGIVVCGLVILVSVGKATTGPLENANLLPTSLAGRRPWLALLGPLVPAAFIVPALTLAVAQGARHNFGLSRSLDVASTVAVAILFLVLAVWLRHTKGIDGRYPMMIIGLAWSSVLALATGFALLLITPQKQIKEIASTARIVALFGSWVSMIAFVVIFRNNGRYPLTAKLPSDTAKVTV
jgi:hypothetical protein